MAIYHCNIKPVSWSSGRSAVAAIAYRAGERLTNERDGIVHDFTRRDGVVHAEIVLPGDRMAGDGSVAHGSGHEWARYRSALWNAAEAAERRKDARVAREVEIALPHELSSEQRLVLTREFSQKLARLYGVGVDFAVHSPHRDSNVLNHHAHIMMTTRKVTEIGEAAPVGLGEKSTFELENKELKALGLPTTHQQIRDVRIAWEGIANEHLARAGWEVRIDHRSHRERGLEIEPTQHMGVHATQMERRGKEVSRTRMTEEAGRRNAEVIREKPDEVLEIVTGEKSVFDRRDVALALHRYIDDPTEFQAAFAKVMASPALVELRAEQKDARGRAIKPARYSTREMVAIERDMARGADRLKENTVFGVARRHVEAAMSRQDEAIQRNGGTGLSDEQRAAVEHVTGDAGIAAVVGLAGAGKSTLLTAARQAWEAQGYRVRGAALSGKAAEGLEESAGITSRTLASWDLSWRRGYERIGSGDVFVIDEAGMVGSKQLSRFITEAAQAGAKVVLVGDPEQLQPIGPGAAFRAVAKRVGFVELVEIRRQREDWQRAASVDFGRYRTAEGLAAYAQHGAIGFEATAEQARATIMRDVIADMEARPDGTRLVLAHRRADVRALNEAIREVRRDRGELGGERLYRTTEGERAFATGDRVLFLKNDGKLGVKNGMLGIVEKATDGCLTVRLDSAQGSGKGRSVSVSPEDYADIDHGYATTIHKAQGATVDRAYVLASETMDRHLTYVAMTRHREGVMLYAGRDEFAGRQGGVLVEHGAAPYEHDPANRQSYFVTLEREGGQRHTVWGADLERAMAETSAGRAKLAIGDRIALEVTASETVRLPDGTTAERHSWQVRGADDLAKERLVSQLSRSGAKETTLEYETAAYAERRGIDLRSEIVVPEASRGRPARAERPDSFAAKVRGAARERPERARDERTKPQDQETRRERLRRQLHGLSGLDLDRATEAAKVRDRDKHYPRDMTVADAARLVSPDYAAAADRLDDLRKDIASSERGIETYAKQRDYAVDQGDERWRKMGTLTQYGHRTGVRPDHAMSVHERAEIAATEGLAAEEKRLEDRMTLLPAAERAEADALEKVRSQAEAKLAELQERAALAREVQQEKMQEQKERDQARARDLGRGRGI
jgi:Ti-type conjugative transfer relaxase TraA